MYKNDNEKRRDLMLGEAVLELLEESTPITNDLLLQKLHSFLNTDAEYRFKTAIYSAIAEVTATTNSPRICSVASDVSDIIFFNTKRLIH